MAYTGGKDGAGVWQRLVNEIPPHEVFVSAFLGDCAIMRHKRPARVNVGIDLAAGTASRFAAAWPGAAAEYGGVTLPELQLYQCDAIAWLAHAFDLYRVHRLQAPALEPATLAAAGQLELPPQKPAAVDRTTDGHHQPPNLATEALVARFGVPAGGVFVYADPPYLLETRRSGRSYYEHEMTEVDHRRLLDVLVSLPCRVMVSHYPHPLYAATLTSWRTFTFRAQTRQGTAIEQVWCNYPVPETLHDVRWLGRDKREREKLTRRRRNLLGKIKRLSPIERQSLLQAVAES